MKRAGRNRRWLWRGLAVLFAAAVAAWGYHAFQPRLLFLGFPDMYRFLLAEAREATGIRYDVWSARDIDDPELEDAGFTGYRAIYVSARRADPLPPVIQEALREASEQGARVFVIPPHHSSRLGVGTRESRGKEEWLGEYWKHSGPENMARFLRATAALHLGEDYPIEPPVPTPEAGYYHPAAPEPFTTTKDYLEWYRASGRYTEGGPRVFVDFADGWKLGMTRATDAVIRAFEERGVNVGAIFGPAHGGPFAVEFKPDLIVSRKHGRWWLGEQGVELLDERLDTPVMRGLSLLFTGETFTEYRKTKAGVRGAGLAMGAVIPELDGAIEPTLIEGLDAKWYGRRYEAVAPERIGRLAERALRWIRLRTLPNADKRIAVIYVSGIGKGKITAASLNAPRSLTGFLNAMKQAGYAVEGAPQDEDALLEEMLTKGRNLSPSQQAEVRKLADMPGVVPLPVEGYVKWFRSLPEKMQQQVEDVFGPPPGRLMTVERGGGTYFVIPKLDFGNVILLPQPARGAQMDARLQHNDRVPPPHQYLAVYWWLREVWKADAFVNYGTHGTLEFLPGRPLGQLADDWSDRVLGHIPNIYVYVMDNVGEALIAKRRGMAVTVSHQVPPLDAAELSRQDTRVGALYRATRQFLGADEGALKEQLRKQIRDLARQLDFDQDLALDWSASAPPDKEIRELQLHIHLINEDRIPLGLHVHGRASGKDELAPLIAAMLGEDFIRRAGGGGKDSAPVRKEQARRKAEAAVRQALAGRNAGLAPEDRRRIAALQEDFAATSQEIPRTLRALRGGYVPPGSGGDPVRNPSALPTGRNLYGINPAEAPTKAAWEVGRQLAGDLLSAEKQRLGRWPRKVGFTLWNTEIIRQYGADLAQILYLLGVKPVWDHRGVVEDLKLIPAAELGRPRIDVVVQAASLFRDTFPDLIKLLDRAVRLANSARDGENYVAQNTGRNEQQLKQAGFSAYDARRYAPARVFSNSAGGYGTGLVNAIERSGGYSGTKELTEAYLARTGALYTADGEWGERIPGLYKQALRQTDSVVLARSTNVVSPLTLDHYFEYLGGMTMAVRDTSGVSPETYIADVRDADEPRMETLRETLTRGLRGKLWNPKWIREMQEEGFSGAAELSESAANLFGWSVTKPEAVDAYVWERVHAVYVKDSLDLGLPQWFDEENPFAWQRLTAVLLESARKGFWQPGKETLAALAESYASSVVRHGPSGDARTVENRALETFVGASLGAAGKQLTRGYYEALDRSEGRPPKNAYVEGRKLVEERGASRDVYQAGKWGALAALVLGAAFLVGARRRR